ncbi:DUF6603 domain-containing protein [Kitasatospora phosalacinea]|uniref:DUF6603 domain-containing protein n=1 Tax=Kitasatospora phosalacinea TaxID=2065 RepID=A0A9W6UL09_9ACTN|nr:DUF6603 domain-containing protein [Kitasatospora phosalacinea]GLW52004.1 hypothetical protein Kpho01_00150 [Kitasatospora phosalacinea]
MEAGMDLSGRTGPEPGRYGIGIDLWASAAVELPGLRLGVDKVRLAVGIALAIENGTVTLALTPPVPTGPDGARAELTLPAFSGGGTLQRRGDEWSGALRARLGPVVVSGFGVLTTDRFSLLALIAAEFEPPLQLSFGFTLVGVGGLVGVNRRPDTEALQAAAHSGDLARLMFPHDPVADAPRLLPVLAAAFPQQDGSTVVGPLLKLGWGTPTLVSATIGVLIGDRGVVLLGKLALTLPHEAAPLVLLQAVVVGTVDGDGLALEASLAGSHLAGIPVDGEIALRVRGGDDPLFALSAGGFHPAFTPPEGMRQLRRIGTEISPGAMLRARLAAYLAVTTNSVQFGAAAELEAAVAGFGIKGGFAFDALIHLDRFEFLADFSAHVSVECADFSVGSLVLSGHLSGPSPWRIRGHATVSVLFFDVDVDVPEITWGSAVPSAPPLVRDPGPVLVAQLAEPANWTVLSGDVPHCVQLRPGAGPGAAAVHPLAPLGFRQTAVPLRVALQRMDGRALPRTVTLDLDVPAPQLREGLFPPGQFRDLDDRARLAASGYAPFACGFDLDPQGVSSPGVPLVRDTSSPETSVLGDDFCLSRFPGALLPGALAAPRRVAPPPAVRPVELRDPARAALTRVRDLTPADAVGAATTHPAVLESLLAAGSELQVSREWELTF